MKELIAKLAEGRSLSLEEAYSSCIIMLKGYYDPIEASALLMGLRVKGETPQEFQGFSKALEENVTRVNTTKKVIDIVGTGGDGLNTINASTLASIVIASMGIPVAKHGNRGFSSLFGSADFMEAVGYPIEHDAKIASKLIDSVNFAFLYAPQYHLALKNIAPVRKKLSIRTIFNLVAPLINPARPTAQIIGTPNEKIANIISNALTGSSERKYAIVTGYPGMDEVSPIGPTRVIIKESLQEIIIHPKDLNLQKIPVEAITGKTKEEIFKKDLEGLKGKDRATSAFIALNSGLALYLIDEVRSIHEGFKKSLNQIKEGLAWRKLNEIVSEARRLVNID
ncbi:MAG: anthranilate phosphoribosyltransferase [Thermoprotei archaeon]